MGLQSKKELKKEMLSSSQGSQNQFIIVAFFFVLSFIIYGKSIGNKYAMDDEYVIHNNFQVHKGIKAIPEIFTTTYVINDQKSSYEYRPLVKAVYAIEYQFFGEKPSISHLFNILLYAFSISFLYFLLLKLLLGYNSIFPFTIALIFLIHPLHSEVVLSIKNRDVLMSFIGCLFSLFFYLKYIETNKLKYILFGAFFMLFAMMSKRDAMTFYAIIPLTLWFFRDATSKKLGIVFISFLVSQLVFRTAAHHVANDINRLVLEWENPLFQNTNILQRIPTGFYSILFYLKMFLIPHPLLSYYGYNQFPIMAWANPFIWIVIAGLCGIGYFVFKKMKSRHIAVYGILFFLISISMFTNILMPVVGIVAERFAYIPSLGLSIISAWGLLKFSDVPFGNIQAKFSSFSSKFYLSLTIIVLIYGGRSFARNSAWKDSYTLYKTDVANARESAHAHALFAAESIQKVRENQKMNVEAKRKYVSDAIIHYKESLRIIPNYLSSLNNLGMVYYTYYNQPSEAIPYLRKAIDLDSEYVEAYFNLATCLSALKKNEEAERMFLKSIAINPQFINSYQSLNKLYSGEKQYDKILKLNHEGISKGIKSDVFYINIGNVYFMNKDTVNAVPFFEKGIALVPNNRKLNSFLAQYYQGKGDLQKASYYYDLMAKSRE